MSLHFLTMPHTKKYSRKCLATQKASTLKHEWGRGNCLHREGGNDQMWMAFNTCFCVSVGVTFGLVWKSRKMWHVEGFCCLFWVTVLAGWWRLIWSIVSTGWVTFVDVQGSCGLPRAELRRNWLRRWRRPADSKGGNEGGREGERKEREERERKRV